MAGSIAGRELRFDCSQFCARFIFDVLHPVGAAIPITGIAQIALDLVQHGMDPRSDGIVFVGLDEFMRASHLPTRARSIACSNSFFGALMKEF